MDTSVSRHFAALRDPRADRGQERRLVDIVTIALCGENRLHWVLDVAFREDDSRARTGHAPQNRAILRHFALNLLRRDPTKGSIATKRFRAALDTTYLRTILTALGS